MPLLTSFTTHTHAHKMHRYTHSQSAQQIQLWSVYYKMSQYLVLLTVRLLLLIFLVAPHLCLSKTVGWVSPIFTFEEGRKSLENWTKTGDAFTNQPTYGDNPIIREPPTTSNHRGDYWIGTFENRSRHPKVELKPSKDTDPRAHWPLSEFLIDGTVVSFLTGRGCTNTGSDERVELLVNDTVVRNYVTNSCAERMSRQSWKVSELINKTARLRLVDDSNTGWGHINFDDFLTHYGHCRGAYSGIFISNW